RALTLAWYLAAVVFAVLPWTIRNWRLTGDLLPTSSHGGTQLWYGTLQTGRYLRSRAENPRSVLEASAFEYTSLANRSLIATAIAPCAPPDTQPVLYYWTDRDSNLRQAAPIASERRGEFQFILTGQPIPTTVYYYVAATRAGAPALHVDTPP